MMLLHLLLIKITWFNSFLLGVTFVLIFIIFFLIRRHRAQDDLIRQMKYDKFLLEQKVKIKEEEIKNVKVKIHLQSVLKEELLRSLQSTVEKDDIFVIKRSLNSLISQFRCQIYKNVG
ncbi:hypothetical protein [Aquimarina sp. 2201CG5-10]|uniref:hypothetical protein n=1 Tax=Aquimarina callyspongiae TaxID=3098150 RepID=UPI002AB58EFB|nr:hypothetical protein [Aquimarina sp. 2201CG5-10]MDY8138016.1 hypothetical protein [Aquimarina sp. 2201CG5-10]